MQNEVPPGVMLMMSLRMSVCMHMSAPVCDCVRANLCCHYCCAVIMILAWHMVFLLCNIMINTRILKLQEHCVRMTKRCCHVATVEVILVALINHWGKGGKLPTEEVTVQTLSLFLEFQTTPNVSRKKQFKPEFPEILSGDIRDKSASNNGESGFSEWKSTAV